MSLEMGMCLVMPIIAFLFFYMSVYDNREYFKMLYQMIGFGLIIASLDVVRRLGEGLVAAPVVEMYTIIMNIMVILFFAILFITFIMVLKDALMMWMPKKKKFSQSRGD